MSRLTDLAEKIVESWHDEGSEVPLLTYMKMSSDEYNVYVRENKLPEDFIERHK